MLLDLIGKLNIKFMLTSSLGAFDIGSEVYKLEF